MNTIFAILFVAVVIVFIIIINRIDDQSKIIKAHGMMIDSIMKSVNQQQQGFISKIEKPVKKAIKSQSKTKKS